MFNTRTQCEDPSAPAVPVEGIEFHTMRHIADVNMPSRQRAVDILRGVAILVVVLYHLISVQVYPEGWWIERGYAYFLGTWMTNGWLGVSLFFVLSGYVLFLPYAQGKRQLTSLDDVRLFYRHRANRLFPLYAISTFVALFILGSFWPQYNIVRAIAMATITFNFFPKYFEPPGNIPLWSLGVEVWYCALFPAISLVLLRFRPWVVFAIVSIASYFIRVIGADLGSRIIEKSVLANLGNFVLGMWIAHSWANSAPWTRWSRLAAFGLALCGFVVMTCASILFDFSHLVKVSVWISSFIIVIFQLGVSLLLIGLLRWGSGENAFSWGTAWALELLGMMCYSLYLWHVPLIGGLKPHVERPLEVTLYLLILMAFGWLSYRYIEFGRVSNWMQLLPAGAVSHDANRNVK